MLVQPAPVSRPIDVTATSYSRVQTHRALERRDAPARYAAAARPQSAHHAAVRAAAPRAPGRHGLCRARCSPCFGGSRSSTRLTPPQLGSDSVDEFLFETKRGFCGHYASAFATLMRAAGIPTRVVTGYQGGTFNRFADYWIVRQSDAHAWDEIWIEGRGWVRIDPTSAIAPGARRARPERRARGGRALGQPLAATHPMARRPASAPRCAAASCGASESWISIRARRTSCCVLLHIPEPDGQKLVMVLAVGLALATCVAHMAGAPRIAAAGEGSADARLRSSVPQIGGGRPATPRARGSRSLCRRASRSCVPISPPRSPPCAAATRCCATARIREDAGPPRVHLGRARVQAARFSRVFMNSISGQRSSVRPRLTRVGARYTSSPA